MGMGYAAAYADVIEEEEVAKLCRKEFHAFEDSRVNSEYDYSDIARAMEYNETENVTPEIVKAYKKLLIAFKKKTGLSLGLAYHDSDDDGSQYDDVSGVYWYVDGMYELTKAGKKYQTIVERKTFCQFG